MMRKSVVKVTECTEVRGNVGEASKIGELTEVTTKREIIEKMVPVLLPVGNLSGDMVSCNLRGLDDIAIAFKTVVYNKKRFLTGEDVESFGITKRDIELYLNDMEYPYKLMRLSDVLGMPDDAGLYVLTNQSGTLGAGSLICKNVLKALCDKFHGKRLYVLPSSKHEVLLLPEDDALVPDIDELIEMVKSINQTVVDEKDFLADHVYMFSAEDGFSTLA